MDGLPSQPSSRMSDVHLYPSEPARMSTHAAECLRWSLTPSELRCAYVWHWP